MAKKSDVQVRRVYDEAKDDDGFRVLVDRLWPRGVTKKKAALDEWCKDANGTPTIPTDLMNSAIVTVSNSSKSSAVEHCGTCTI